MQLSKTKSWYAGNTGTPEYFRTDCKFINGLPNSGRAYVGLILYGGYTDAIEYIGAALNDTLTAGSRYCVSFYVRAADSYTYIDQIGLRLTKEKDNLNMWAPIYKKPHIYSNYSEPITPELGWHKVSGEYNAEGGEQHLMIGNFFEPDKHVKSINEFFDYPGLGWNSYYLIDDVSVVELNANESCENIINQPVPISERPSVDTFKLENTFYFDSDAYDLTAIEFQRLVKWKIELRQYRVLGAIIEANTDSDANEGYNLRLSEKRSRYILSILSSLLSAKDSVVKNNGELTPIGDNSNEEGKALNRNVTVKIIAIDK